MSEKSKKIIRTSIGKIWFVFLLLILLSSGIQLLKAQENNPLRKDTAYYRIEPVDISDISLKSSELKLKVKQEIRDLISDNAVRRIKSENYILLSSIDPDLFIPIDPYDVKISIRDLEYKQVKYQQIKRKLDEQKIYLTEIIHNLDSLKYNLVKETERWKVTKNILGRDSLTSSIPVKLLQTITFLDSTQLLISEKSNSLLQIIDNTIQAGVEIDAQYDKNRALIKSKQKNIFRSDHPSFFSMNFNANYRHEIHSSLTKMVQVDLVELRDYLFTNTNSLLLTLFLFGGLIYLFVFIREKVKIKDTGFGYFYKQNLLKVISRPVSASVILSLFFTLFIFPDRPPIFREFSFYLIAFPLIHILNILLGRKFRIYYYTYGTLVILYLILLLFPNDLVIYRLLLLLIATAEIILLAMLLRLYRLSQELSTRKQMSYFFIALHLVLAVLGLAANISGKLILTEIVLFAVFFNIYNGLVLFITVLQLNGLISTGIDTAKGQQINVFRIYGELIKQKAIYFLNTIAIGIWIVLILRNFRMLDVVYGSLKSIFTTKISIGFASFSLDGFLIFFLVIYVSVLISKILRIVLEEDVLNRFPLSKGLPHTIAMMVRYIFIAGGFFLAVNAAGIPIDKFTIILGAMSVGIGFGLQNIFNNLVSGLILLFERPIQLGDTVQVGQLTGNVQSIGLRSSNIKTFEGAEVIVPNGQLVSNEVINWTLSDQKRRIELTIQVGYDSDPKLVHQLLSNILLGHEEIVKDPEPGVYFSEFGESSLDFVLLFWIGDYIHGRRIKSEILFQVFQVLKDNKIEIPFPQRDLHIRSTVPDLLRQNENDH